jgi:hypothetical protein
MKRKGLPVSSDTLCKNIVSTFVRATPEQYASGLTWYQNAHYFAQALADKYHCPLERIVGVIAALSPATSWEQNQIDAVRILEWRYNPNARVEHAIVTTYPANRAKAERLVNGADPLDVLGGRKVLAFHALIADPGKCCVCIDRHAVRVAVGKDNLDTCARYLQRVGVYAKLTLAYQTVAGRLGLLPHQIQAICWLVYKEQRK